MVAKGGAQVPRQQQAEEEEEKDAANLQDTTTRPCQCDDVEEKKEEEEEEMWVVKVLRSPRTRHQRQHHVGGVRVRRSWTDRVERRSIEGNG